MGCGGALLLLVGAVCVTSETLLDLSHDLAEDSIKWVTMKPFKRNFTFNGYTTGGYWLENGRVDFAEHTSTHMDAPAHFGEGKHTVDQIPLAHLITNAVVIDISAKAARDPNAALTEGDVSDWLRTNGEFPDKTLVLVRTGWGARYNDSLEYFGSDNVSEMAFPGISLGAAQLLTRYTLITGRRVVGVGIDTASLDPGNSTNFLAHQELAKYNTYGIENVANLEFMPVKGAEVTVMPIKIRGGSGGPCRLLARMHAALLRRPFVG